MCTEFNATMSKSDILDVRALEEELKGVELVINCAGKTGRPNIDWCEATPENKRITKYCNTFAPVVLYDVCRRLGVKMVHMSSGCLWGEGEDVREEDEPRPPSHYSETKATGDKLLGGNDSEALIIRIRMPMDGIPHQRNLITKLAGYSTVLSAPNSVTVIDDLAEALKHLVGINARGIYNVVNTGPITGQMIINSYRRHVDPDHECRIIDVDEFAKSGLTKAARSNCTLNNEKLLDSGFDMPAAEDRLEDCMKRYAKGG